MLLFCNVFMVSSPFHFDAKGLPTLLRSGCPSSPLLLPIKRVLSSSANANADGYHPVGINPITALWPRSAILITAIELLSAFATYRSLRLLSISIASGVEPSGASGVNVVERRSTTSSLFVSITWIVLSFEQATNRRPSDESFMSLGFMPTCKVRITLFVSVSITLTLSLAQFDTNNLRPSLLRTVAYGLISTGILVAICCVVASNTTTLLGPVPVPRLAA